MTMYTYCSYCRESVAMTATVCPHCRSKISMGGGTYRPLDTSGSLGDMFVVGIILWLLWVAFALVTGIVTYP